MGESEERRILLVVGGFEKIPREKKGVIEMQKNDLISREYAIKQMEIAISETEDKEEICQFERFIDFLRCLPPTFGNVIADAVAIIREEIVKDNELRKGFIASIVSAIDEYTAYTELPIIDKPALAEKILDRIIGED